MPRTNSNWWQWEPEEESRQRAADAFKADTSLSPEESAWKQAMLNLPPVGPAARAFFEAAPTPTPVQPKAPPAAPQPTSAFDWGKALSGVGEAVGAGLGAAGEAIGGLAPAATSQLTGQWGQAKPNPLPEWTPAWAKAGLSETTPALAARAGAFGEPAKVEAESLVPPEETRAAFNPLEKSGEMLVSFIADPITYLSFGVGGMVGKAAFQGAKGLAPKIGASVVGQALGMGGISAAQSPLRQIAETGQVDVGQTAGDVARGLGTGAAFGIAGEAANIGLAGVKSPLLKQLGKLAAEVASMGAVPAGMEGRLPTAEDFVVGAGMVLGMKAGRELPRMVGSRLPQFSSADVQRLAARWVDTLPDAEQAALNQDSVSFGASPERILRGNPRVGYIYKLVKSHGERVDLSKLEFADFPMVGEVRYLGPVEVKLVGKVSAVYSPDVDGIRYEFSMDTSTPPVFDKSIASDLIPNQPNIRLPIEFGWPGQAGWSNQGRVSGFTESFVGTTFPKGEYHISRTNLGEIATLSPQRPAEAIYRGDAAIIGSALHKLATTGDSTTLDLPEVAALQSVTPEQRVEIANRATTEAGWLWDENSRTRYFAGRKGGENLETSPLQPHIDAIQGFIAEALAKPTKDRLRKVVALDKIDAYIDAHPELIESGLIKDSAKDADPDSLMNRMDAYRDADASEKADLWEAIQDSVKSLTPTLSTNVETPPGGKGTVALTSAMPGSATPESIFRILAQMPVTSKYGKPGEVRLQDLAKELGLQYQTDDFAAVVADLLKNGSAEAITSKMGKEGTTIYLNPETHKQANPEDKGAIQVAGLKLPTEVETASTVVVRPPDPLSDAVMAIPAETSTGERRRLTTGALIDNLVLSDKYETFLADWWDVIPEKLPDGSRAPGAAEEIAAFEKAKAALPELKRQAQALYYQYALDSVIHRLVVGGKLAETSGADFKKLAQSAVVEASKAPNAPDKSERLENGKYRSEIEVEAALARFKGRREAAGLGGGGGEVPPKQLPPTVDAVRTAILNGDNEPTIPDGYSRLYRGEESSSELGGASTSTDVMAGRFWTLDRSVAETYGDRIWYLDIPTIEVPEGAAHDVILAPQHRVSVGAKLLSPGFFDLGDNASTVFGLLEEGRYKEAADIFTSKGVGKPPEPPKKPPAPPVPPSGPPKKPPAPPVPPSEPSPEEARGRERANGPEDEAAIQELLKAAKSGVDIGYTERELRDLTTDDLDSLLGDARAAAAKKAAGAGGGQAPPPEEPPVRPGGGAGGEEPPPEEPIGGRKRPQTSEEWTAWKDAEYPGYSGRLTDSELYMTDTTIRKYPDFNPADKALVLKMVEASIDDKRSMAPTTTVTEVKERGLNIAGNPELAAELIRRIKKSKTAPGVLSAQDEAGVELMIGSYVREMGKVNIDELQREYELAAPGSPRALDLTQQMDKYQLIVAGLQELIAVSHASASGHGLALRMRQEAEQGGLGMKDTPLGRAIKLLDAKLRAMGGTNPEGMSMLMDQINRMLQEGDMKGVYKMLNSLEKMTPSEVAFKVWLGNVLSNIGTQVTNATSNLALGAIENLAVRPLSVATQKLLVPGTKSTKAQQQPRTLGEMREVVKAMFAMGKGTALAKAMHDSAHILAEGATQEQMENPTKDKWAFGGKEFRGEYYNLETGKFEHSTLGSALRPYNYVSRGLFAADMFFKTVTFEAEISALAYRDAIKAVPNRNAHPVEFIAAMEAARHTESNIQEATAKAAFVTMTNKAGPLAEMMLTLRNTEIPLGGGKTAQPLKYIFPFINIIANMMERGIRLSPVGGALALRDFNPWSLVRDKTTGKLHVEQTGSNPDAAQRMAEMVVGSGIMGLGMMLYSSGMLTGAPPKTQAERDAWYKLYQPYSFKVGDKWISYQFLYPVAVPLMMAASLGDVMSDPRQDLAGKGIQEKSLVAASIVGKAILDVPMLTAIANISDAVLNQIPGAAEKLESDLAGGFVPGSSFLRRAQRLFDPMLKDPENFLERLMSNIPALSKLVPDKLDVYGQPVEREELTGASPGGLGKVLSAFSPTPISITDENSKVARLTVALQSLGISPGAVGKALMLDTNAPLDPNMPRRKPTPLTREQQREYQMNAGKLMFDGLDAFVNSPEWNKMSDQSRADRITSIMGRAKDEARRQIFQPPTAISAVREQLAQRVYRKTWDDLGPSEQIKLSTKPEYAKAYAESAGQHDRPINMLSGTALGQNIQLRLSGPIQTELDKAGVKISSVNRSIPSAGGRLYYLDNNLFTHYQNWVQEALQVYLGQVLANKQFNLAADVPGALTPEQRTAYLKKVVQASMLAAQKRTLAEAVAMKGNPAVYGK